MSRCIAVLLLLSVFSETWSQNCDVRLLDYTNEGGVNNDEHVFTVEIINAENCGCNEYTQWDGNTCTGNGSHTGNNENISSIVFGLHYWPHSDVPDCASTSNFHPGWVYTFGASTFLGGWESGTTVQFTLTPPFGWTCLLDSPQIGTCWEVVIWQINNSQTATIDDFPQYYWSDTCGTCANQTQVYPDVNLLDNRLVFCPDPEDFCPTVPPDTVEVETLVYDTLVVTVPEVYYDTITLIDVVDNFIYDTTYVELPPDTVYVPWEWYFYDTTYVNVYDTIYVNTLDTIIITEIEWEYVYVTDTVEVLTIDTLLVSQVDTLFQEIVIYEYITETDTVYEYVTQLVDCDTGLPCQDGFWEEDCRSVFVPSAFSPNNDGINDAFYAVSESYTCWKEWRLQLYNRWGDLVWQTNDPDEYWYGQVQNGNHFVADGVYVWVLQAQGYDALTLDLQGSVTVFR